MSEPAGAALPEAPMPGFEAGAGFHHARKNRKRMYLRAIWSGAGAKAINIPVQVAVVGLTVRYLRAERYGLWLSVSTLLGWIALANFGLGNGLTTRLSAAYGREDRRAADTAVWSTLAIVLAVAMVLATITLVAGPYVPWARIFNVSSPQVIAEATPTAVNTILLVVLLLPLGLSTNVLVGHQRIDLTNACAIAGSLVGLGLLVIATRLKAGLPTLAFVFLSPQLLAASVQWIVAARLDLVRWRPRAAELGHAWQMLTLGSQFLLLQLLGLIVFQTDVIIIDQRLGVAASTPYGITNRMVMIIITMFNIFLTPLWPAYGEAFAKGDHDWVGRIFRKSVWLVLGLWVPMALVLGFSGRWVVRLWAGPDAVPDHVLLWAQIGFTLAFALGSVTAFLLNGVGQLWSQMIGSSAMAIVQIPLAWWLCGKFGAGGVALSQTAVMFTLCLPLVYYHTHRVIHGRGAPARPAAPPPA